MVFGEQIKETNGYKIHCTPQKRTKTIFYCFTIGYQKLQNHILFSYNIIKTTRFDTLSYLTISRFSKVIK